MFHNLVDNSLYTTKWENPDTCTAVAFLTTRVREPNKYYWGKIVNIMKYIRGTRDIPLVLSTNDSGVLKWWIDAPYAVHPNMRVHTGGVLSMGRGLPIVTYNKHNLNTRSSTESDIFVFHDCIMDVLWTRYFMEYQGYQVMEKHFLLIQKYHHPPV